MKKTVPDKSQNLSVTTKRIISLKGSLSQKDFAKKINTTQSNVSKLVNGTPPSAATLKALSEVYNVSVDWLLGISDQPKIAKSDSEKKTYSDVIAIFVFMLENNSISILNTDDYGNPLDNPTDIHVNDRFLQFLLSQRYHLNSVNYETKKNWLNTILQKYSDLPLVNWIDAYSDAIDNVCGCDFSEDAIAQIIRNLTQA